MTLLLLPVGQVYRLFTFACALYYGGVAFDYVGCPALVGELVMGMVLGPHAAKLLSHELVEALKVAGLAGLLLMVLEGGLAMDADVIRDKGARAVVLAATGTALPVLLGWATMLALGHSSTHALSSGIALSSTAIGFTLRMMTDMKLLETAEGQLITAAAMIDDVFSLILLAMLTVLQETEGGSGDDGGASNVGWLVVRPLLSSAVVLLVGYGLFIVVDRHAPEVAASRLLSRLPGGVRAMAEARASEGLLLLLMAGGVLAAWLAEGFHSSQLLGVFAVGTIFCTHATAQDCYATVAPVQAWLSRLFFGATVGFVVPIDDLFEGGALGEGLVLTLAAILGKFLSGAWAESISGEEPTDGFASRYYWGAFLRVGCAMIGRGELGFLLVTTSLEDRIINRRAYSATIWALILATLIGPFAFRLSSKATSLQRPAARTASKSQAVASTRRAGSRPAFFLPIPCGTNHRYSVL